MLLAFLQLLRSAEPSADCTRCAHASAHVLRDLVILSPLVGRQTLMHTGFDAPVFLQVAVRWQGHGAPHSAFTTQCCSELAYAVGFLLIVSNTAAPFIVVVRSGNVLGPGISSRDFHISRRMGPESGRRSFNTLRRTKRQRGLEDFATGNL